MHRVSPCPRSPLKSRDTRSPATDAARGRSRSAWSVCCRSRMAATAARMCRALARVEPLSQDSAHPRRHLGQIEGLGSLKLDVDAIVAPAQHVGANDAGGPSTKPINSISAHA